MNPQLIKQQKTQQAGPVTDEGARALLFALRRSLLTELAMIEQALGITSHGREKQIAQGHDRGVESPRTTE